MYFSCVALAFIIYLGFYALGFTHLSIKNNIMQRPRFMQLKRKIMQVTYRSVSTQEKYFEPQNS